MLTIATPINITAIVASRRILVVVDVGDRRADGNGYEDEEPREAAYRPRLRHPRDDGGQAPRPERFITKTAGRLIVIFGPRHGTIRSDRSKAATSRSSSGAPFSFTTMLSLFPPDARCYVAQSQYRQKHVQATPSNGYHRGVSSIIILCLCIRLRRSLLRLFEARHRGERKKSLSFSQAWMNQSGILSQSSYVIISVFYKNYEIQISTVLAIN